MIARRDRVRPGTPFDSLTPERQAEIRREKRRRNRLARSQRESDARTSSHEGARQGIHNMSLLSEGESRAAGENGGAVVTNNHSPPSNTTTITVALAINSQSSHTRGASANSRSEPRQQPGTPAINSRSTHQANIRGKSPLHITSPPAGSEHVESYEVNLLLLRSGRHVGQYVFETRRGGETMVFFETIFLETARTVLEEGGYGVEVPAANPRQMSLVVPRKLVPPSSMPAAEQERRLKEVPEIINQYNLGLGMPAASITFRGQKREQLAGGEGEARTRVRVWVNVTEAGAAYLATVGNTLRAGSAMVTLRPAGGLPRTTPASAPDANRVPHRSDNS